MITCKDCIHHDVCADCYESERDTGDFDKHRPYEAEDCVFFKDKANFVEVVRCKDCKHFGKDMGYGKHDCKKYEMPYCLETDFCSYGKRKEGEKDEDFC